MYCTGRFYVDSKDYPMLRCNVCIPPKPTNKSGMVRNYSGAPKFHIAIESTSDTHLLQWINQEHIKEHVQVRFINNFQLGADKVFDLYDVICVRNREYFWGTGSHPMMNTITLIPAIMYYNGVGPVVQAWHIQDPKAIMKGTETKITERPLEGELTDCYFEDNEGNRITKVKPDQIVYAIINSSKLKGDIIDIDLSDDEVDYEYNGQYLENDLLENISVTSDTMKIELKTLRQRN